MNRVILDTATIAMENSFDCPVSVEASLLESARMANNPVTSMNRPTVTIASLRSILAGFSIVCGERYQQKQTE